MSRFSVHNVVEATSEIHYFAGSGHGEFWTKTITIKTSDGETVTIELYCNSQEVITDIRLV